ncbi:hypothetical protein [Acidovorax sp.]|uniref:hypothetical protein n=1 Tax=Acidovorax sp. TaxID=1872122 RepID=UPI00391F34F8
MYLELLIFPTALNGQRVYNETARSIVAKACESFAVDPRIFARGPEGNSLNAVYPTGDGTAIAQPPLIAFGGGKGFIRLTGLGAEGVQVLRDNMQMICAALGAHYEGGYRFRFNEGHCTLAQLHGHVHSYFLPKMCISKKPRRLLQQAGIQQHGERLTLEHVRPLIVEQIKNGLVAQSRFMDESYRSIGQPGMATMEGSLGTDEMLNIEVHEAGPNFQSIKPGEKAQALFANEVVITMSVDLGGPWYFGGLRSRGTGQIFRR